jgi:cell division protease FtsH
MKSKKLLIAGIVLVLTGFVIFAATAARLQKGKETATAYKDFIENVENNEVDTVYLSDSNVFSYTLKGSSAIYYTDNPRSGDFKERLMVKGVTVSENNMQSVGLLGGLLGAALVGAMFFFSFRSSAKSKSSIKVEYKDFEKTDKALTLADVAGNDEAKESAKDIVDFIRNPEKYKKFGARMPKGVIFYGPPGTGKTLMAKAIAGEADAAFYSVSGSDFVQMYVGVGASRIRDLFKKASENKKAVIFIDEIDALGKKRTGESSGGSDERDQTLNALLTEMSGFASKDNVTVVAATNRLDILDEALLRPGRFDRQIEISLPDVSARKKILEYYIKDRPVAEEIKIEDLAKQTVYFSGAALENFVNEASILAAKSDCGQITAEMFDKAYYTIAVGAEKLDRSAISERDREITAYHESGHAFMTKLRLPKNSVPKVTIIPSANGVGGFSVSSPPDVSYYTKKDLESQIMVCLAGRAAEEIAFGSDNVTTGARNDIERATMIAKDYVASYGMSEAGIINQNVFRSDGEAKEECSKLLRKLYEETKALLETKWNLMERAAKDLLEKETLKEEDLNLILNG